MTFDKKKSFLIEVLFFFKRKSKESNEKQSSLPFIIWLGFKPLQNKIRRIQKVRQLEKKF